MIKTPLPDIFLEEILNCWISGFMAYDAIAYTPYGTEV